MQRIIITGLTVATVALGCTPSEAPAPKGETVYDSTACQIVSEKTQDYAGNVEEWSFNYQGDKLVSADTDGWRILFDYDAEGTLVAIGGDRGRDGVVDTDPYFFEYDADGRMTRWDVASTGSWRPLTRDNLTIPNSQPRTLREYTYDESGNLVTYRLERSATDTVFVLEKTYDDGNVVRQEYDGLEHIPYGDEASVLSGRPAKAPLSPVATYEYDQANRLTRARMYREADAEPHITRTFRYDADGRVSSMTHTEGSHISYGFAYEYDDAGKLVRRTRKYDPDEEKLWSYDDSGRVTSSQTTSRWNKENRRWTYDDAGRVIMEEDLLRGRKLEFVYGERGNLVSAQLGRDDQGTLDRHYTWAYDDHGNLLQEVEAILRQPSFPNAGSRRHVVTYSRENEGLTIRREFEDSQGSRRWTNMTDYDCPPRVLPESPAGSPWPEIPSPRLVRTTPAPSPEPTPPTLPIDPDETGYLLP